MPRIVFELQVEATAATLAEALTTQHGIAGWWTDDVSLAGGAEATMTLGFPIAPRPFQLRIDEAGQQHVAWSSVGEFPPHWAGTKMAWTLKPAGNSTIVHFVHDGWATDEGPFGSSALTWARLMDTLKRHAETGTPAPLFHAA